MNRKFEDITGKRFGSWTVLYRSYEKQTKGRQNWMCQCDCGTKKLVNKFRLTHGQKIKCNKCPKPIENWHGRKFGKFTVLKVSDKKNVNCLHWDCECECGTILSIPAYTLKNGHRTHCRKCTYEDLTGQRFGHQIVLRRDHATRKWLVRCDCGEEKLKANQTIKQSQCCGRCETKNHIGKKFGKLTALEIVGYSQKKSAIGKFQCDCGNIKIAEFGSVTTGKLSSCGCLPHEINLNKSKRLIGMRIGDLTLKKINGFEPGTRRVIFLCRCICGKEILLKSKCLGSIKSCGCLISRSRSGEKSHLSKIKNQEAISIRELYKTGFYKVKEIAKLYNLHESCVYKIIKGKSYKNI